MLALNFGFWQFWETYNPASGYLGPQKVTFDGPNKLILINFGETEINFRDDVYSAWKEWILDPTTDNARYLPALSVVGGDPLPGERALGSTYFLENGWRIRTWDGDHTLTIEGNIYTREGATPFVPTLRRVSTAINIVTSTLVETLIPETSLSNTDVTAIAGAVWDQPITSHVTAGTTGNTLSTVSTTVNETKTTVDQIDTNVVGIPTTPAPDANTVADAVWANNTGVQVANTTTRLLKLAEADEELTSNTAIKRDKDTNEILLQKNITGVEDSNTSITITSP